jgi:ribosomal protein S18 acetylase RimI-like enzyme
MSEYQIVRASRFDLETLARLYTRTFEGYFYPAVITPAMLASFIHVEDLDLDLSPVLTVHGELVAFATVGLRGKAAYCRGFGVIPEFRGKGLANALCDAMLQQARRAHAVKMTLGVLIENQGAVKTYLRGGFKPARELHSVEWKRTDHSIRAKPLNASHIESSCALERFNVLHSIPSIWNRDLPSLCKMADLCALGILEHDVLTAYVLYHVRDDKLEIQDLTAAGINNAIILLHHLQSSAAHIVCYNEPEPSPMHGAFRACDFAITHRRYEMIAEV